MRHLFSLMSFLLKLDMNQLRLFGQDSIVTLLDAGQRQPVVPC